MGGGHSKNVGPDLTTTSFLSPLFQEHPHFRALPYTKSLEESIGKNGCSYFIFIFPPLNVCPHLMISVNYIEYILHLHVS
jgi:hypothetical protein